MAKQKQQSTSAFERIRATYTTDDAKKKISMPLHDIDPDEKQKMSYFVKTAEYLFTLGANNRLHCANKVTGDSKMYETRRYARNNINLNKYRNILLGKDGKGNQREKSFMNISWRPDLGFLHTRDQMRGAYEKIDYEVQVKAIDPASDWERKLEIAALKIHTNPIYKNLLAEIGVATGKPKYEFNSEEDVEVFVKTGGLKLRTEIAMKKAIDCSVNESKWRNLKAMLMDDMVDIGIAATKDYVDTLTRVPMVRYVDPENLLIPSSKYLDFRDAVMAGELVEMTIADIRAQSDLDEQQLWQIACKWGYTNSSSTFNADAVKAYYEANSCFPYDHVKVSVLDCAWLSSDIKKWSEKVIEKYGTLEYSKKHHGYSLPPQEAKKGKKLKVKRAQFCYQCKWIIGSEFAFSYGKEYYQIREGAAGFKKSLLPFHVTTIGTVSKMERMIPDIDEINILTYKRRNAIACIPAPPGIVIDKDAMENTIIDGQIKTSMELFNMFVEKGTIALRTEDEHGNKVANINSMFGTAGNNLFEQFRIFSEQIAEKRANIKITTGINDVVDGTSDAERRLKVEGEAKLEAANNAMQMEYAQMRELMQNTFTNIMYRWQEVVRAEDFTTEYRPIDAESIEYLTLTKDMASVTFGMKIEIGSTYQERMNLLQELISLKDARRNSGKGGLSQDAYIMVRREVLTGNIQLAQLMLSKAIKEQEAQDQQIARENAEHTSDQQIKSAQAAEVEKRRTALAIKSAEIIVNHSAAIDEFTKLILESALEKGDFDTSTIRDKANEVVGNPKDQLALLKSVLTPEDVQAIQAQQGAQQAQPQPMPV